MRENLGTINSLLIEPNKETNIFYETAFRQKKQLPESNKLTINDFYQNFISFQHYRYSHQDILELFQKDLSSVKVLNQNSVSSAHKIFLFLRSCFGYLYEVLREIMIYRQKLSSLNYKNTKIINR